MMVGEIVAKMRLDLTEFQSGLAKAKSLLEQHSESAMRAATVLAGIGGGIGAGLAYAAKEAIAFEREMRNVNSIVQASEEDFRGMSEAVRAMAKETGQGPAILARGLYDIASSGFAGQQGLEVLKASAVAATAGLSDTATASKAVTAVLNAYGLSASEAGRVSDVLFQTVKVGVVTFPELAQNIGDVVGTAAQAKVPLEELGAAISTMTKSGITPAEAVTSLNQLLLSFIQPSEEAKAAAAELGLEWNATALASRGLSGMMTQLGAALKLRGDEMEATARGTMSLADATQIAAQRTGLSIETVAALLTNVRALRGGLALASREGRTFAGDLGEMADAAGAAQAAFEEQSKSFAVMWAKSKAGAQAYLAQVGSALIPGLKLLAGVLAMVVKIGEAVPGPFRVIGVVIAGLVGAMAAAAAAWITWGLRCQEAIALLRQWITAIGAARVASLSLGASLGWIGLVAAAIGVAVAAWQSYADAQKKAKEEARQHAEAVIKTSEAVAELLPKLKAVNDEIAKAKAAGKEPTKEQKETRDKLIGDLAHEIPNAFTVDPVSGKARQRFPLDKMVSEMKAEEKKAWAEVTEDRRKNAKEAEEAVSKAQDDVRRAKERRDEARAKAEHLPLYHSELGFDTRTVEERKKRYEDLADAAQRAWIKAGEAVQSATKAYQAQVEELDKLEAQNRQVATESEKAAEAQKKANTERLRGLKELEGAVKQLRSLGAPTGEMEGFTRRLLEFVQHPAYGDMRKAPEELKQGWAAAGEAAGGAMEVALRNAVIQYTKLQQMAEEAKADKGKSTHLRQAAELQLLADLSKARKEEEAREKQAQVAAMELGKRKRDERIGDLQRELVSWREAADALKESGKMSLGAWLKQLIQMVEWLRRENRGMATPSADLLQRERELTKTIFTERDRLVKGLREREKQAHEERLRWSQEEKEQANRLYQHRMSVVDLVLEGEADRRKLRGEKPEAIATDQAKERLKILEAMRPSAKPLTAEQIEARRKQIEEQLVHAAEGTEGRWLDEAERKRQADLARTLAGELEQPLPAEARMDWAKQWREAALQGFSEKRITQSRAEEMLREAQAVMMQAQQDLKREQMEIYEAKRAEHDLTLSQIEKEATTWREALAGVGGEIEGLVDRIGGAWRKQLEAALQGSGPTTAAAAAGVGGRGRITTEGAEGGRTIQFFVGGRTPQQMKLTPKQEADLVAKVDQVIAENLGRDQQYPRG